MNCKMIAEQLDNYLVGDLNDAPLHQFDQHLDECIDCQKLVGRQRDLQRRLVDYGQYSIAMPDAAYYDRVIARAAHSGAREQRKRWVMTGFGGALAAMLAIWVVSGVFFTATDIDDTAVPSVTMALASPHTFNLVFSSAKQLSNASMTVSLPEGIEIAGFAGQREITWQTSLREGQNILPLTLIATSPVGGELLATLRHEDDDKIFRLRVAVIKA